MIYPILFPFIHNLFHLIVGAPTKFRFYQVLEYSNTFQIVALSSIYTYKELPFVQHCN
jgi:hypothetical protein